MCSFSVFTRSYADVLTPASITLRRGRAVRRRPRNPGLRGRGGSGRATAADADAAAGRALRGRRGENRGGDGARRAARAEAGRAVGAARCCALSASVCTRLSSTALPDSSFHASRRSRIALRSSGARSVMLKSRGDAGARGVRGEGGRGVRAPGGAESGRTNPAVRGDVGGGGGDT